MDPTWGHLTIKMSGHPPFGAQVILNGHEYVACTAHAAEVGFAKEGNCFTGIGEPERLAQIADTLSQPGTAGRLGQVIDAWIYTACLCFGLDLAEQQASYFHYAYSVYQVEYSRNLIFDSGRQMEQLFDTIVDRIRTRLDMPAVRTLFGVGHRPHRPDPELSPRQGVVIQRPHWNLTIFKIHFGLLTLKAYTKGERVLRFEAIVHNTTHAAHRPGPGQVRRDRRPAGRHGRPVHHHARLRRRRLPARRHPRPATPPSQIGAVRVGGIDTNKPRTRSRDGRGHRAGRSPPTGSPSPTSPPRSAPDTGSRLHRPAGRLRPAQTPRQKSRRQTRPWPPLPGSRRRRPNPHRLVTLRDHVIAPVLAGVRKPVGRHPNTYTRIDRDYDTLRTGLRTLFTDLGIAHRRIDNELSIRSASF